MKKVLYILSNFFPTILHTRFSPQSFASHHFTTHIYPSHYTPLSQLLYAALHYTSLHFTTLFYTFRWFSLHFLSLHFSMIFHTFYFSLAHLNNRSPYPLPSFSIYLVQCFSTFVRPRPDKFFFYKTRARSQQIYS